MQTQEHTLSLSLFSVVHQIPQPLGDSWHLLIIRVFLIIVETVPVERSSRERHVKTSSTVKDQTASVMGKLVRGTA